MKNMNSRSSFAEDEDVYQGEMSPATTPTRNPSPSPPSHQNGIVSSKQIMLVLVQKAAVTPRIRHAESELHESNGVNHHHQNHKDELETENEDYIVRKFDCPEDPDSIPADIPMLDVPLIMDIKQEVEENDENPYPENISRRETKIEVKTMNYKEEKKEKEPSHLHKLIDSTLNNSVNGNLAFSERNSMNQIAEQVNENQDPLDTTNHGSRIDLSNMNVAPTFDQIMSMITSQGLLENTEPESFLNRENLAQLNIENIPIIPTSQIDGAQSIETLAQHMNNIQLMQQFHFYQMLMMMMNFTKHESVTQELLTFVKNLKLSQACSQPSAEAAPQSLTSATENSTVFLEKPINNNQQESSSATKKRKLDSVKNVRRSKRIKQLHLHYHNGFNEKKTKELCRISNVMEPKIIHIHYHHSENRHDDDDEEEEEYISDDEYDDNENINVNNPHDQLLSAKKKKVTKD